MEYLYTTRYRPPGFGTVPKGWRLVERPKLTGMGFDLRTDLPVSRDYAYGVIGYDRQMTAEEVDAYEMIRVRIGS